MSCPDRRSTLQVHRQPVGSIAAVRRKVSVCIGALRCRDRRLKPARAAGTGRSASPGLGSMSNGRSCKNNPVVHPVGPSGGDHCIHLVPAKRWNRPSAHLRWCVSRRWIAGRTGPCRPRGDPSTVPGLKPDKGPVVPLLSREELHQDPLRLCGHGEDCPSDHHRVPVEVQQPLLRNPYPLAVSTLLQDLLQALNSSGHRAVWNSKYKTVDITAIHGKPLHDA